MAGGHAVELGAVPGVEAGRVAEARRQVDPPGPGGVGGHPPPAAGAVDPGDGDHPGRGPAGGGRPAHATRDSEQVGACAGASPCGRRPPGRWPPTRRWPRRRTAPRPGRRRPPRRPRWRRRPARRPRRCRGAGGSWAAGRSPRTVAAAAFRASASSSVTATGRPATTRGAVARRPRRPPDPRHDVRRHRLGVAHPQDRAVGHLAGHPQQAGRQRRHQQRHRVGERWPGHGVDPEFLPVEGDLLAGQQRGEHVTYSSVWRPGVA